MDLMNETRYQFNRNPPPVLNISEPEKAFTTLIVLVEAIASWIAATGDQSFEGNCLVIKREKTHLASFVPAEDNIDMFR